MPRRPYPRLIAVTALAAIPAILLLVLISAPVAPGCFEYCELGQDFAVIGLRFVAVAWLVVWLRVAWNWRTREPTVAAVSAMVAGGFILFVAFTVLAVEPFGRRSADLEQIAWTLGLGLQLPPVWRLSRRMPPSLPLRVLGWVMGALVVIAVLACVFLGASNFGSGRTIVFVAWAVFVACLLLLAVAAYRDRIAPRSVAGPLIAACSADPPHPSRDRGAGRSRHCRLHGDPVHRPRLAVGRVHLAPNSGACWAASGRGHSRHRRLPRQLRHKNSM